MIYRDRLFATYRVLNPIAVRRRLHDLQRRKKEFIVPGPNYMWSIDGHCKLDPYGVEIYAAIDTYSRYIVWIYIGVSGLTAVSVLRQFLDAIKSVRQIPQVLRSDRGVETTLIAEAQWQLHQAYEPDIPFEEVYAFGTSKENQRIEGWWPNLTKTALPYWHVCIPLIVRHMQKINIRIRRTFVL
jgi:hypothetical protein